MIMENSEKLWTGKVPDNWKFYKGKYIFGERSERGNAINLQLLSPTQKYGVIPQSMYDELTSMKSVKVKEDTDLSTFKTIHRGDFCISLRSFQGGFEYSEYEGVVSPAYHVLFSKMDICAGYYKYLFKEQRFIAEMNSYCQSLRDGKNISYFDFGRTLIPFPPLSEQQSIADYLDKTCSKIDEIIAEAKASIDEYKELKQSVIFEAVTKGVNSNVELKNSGNEWIGMMPSNKRLTKVKYCGNFKKGPFGSAITKDMFVEKGANTFKVYEQKNAIYSDCTLGYYYISKDKYEELQGFAIQPRDIIVSCAGTIGKTYVLPDNCEPGIINQALMRIRLYDKIDRTYFSYLFESLLEYAGKKYSNGSAIKNIPPFAILNNLWIVDFDVNEQIEISEYLNIKLPQIDSLIAEKESLINDLEAYKKSLIYEVVTGKRRVV